MLALLVAAVSAGPQVPIRFGDWVVGCDNRRDCEAVGLPPEHYGADVPPVVGIIVSRRAEPGAEPAIGIDHRFFELADYSSDIVADGRKTGLHFDRAGNFAGDSRQFAKILAGANIVKLVAPTGETLGSFPTAGASAALRWMDNRQQRAGTVTAIVARGERPPSFVPAPPELPRIAVPAASSKPPRRLSAPELAEIRKPFECDDEPREDLIDFHRLDTATSVAIVSCWNGPYQSDGIIVLVPDEGGYRLAPMDPEPGVAAGQSVNERSRLISPYYDPGTRLLSMEYRGRGFNDCGANGSWAWDGTAFRLARYAALDFCRLVSARISYWQTQNDPASADE